LAAASSNGFVLRAFSPLVLFLFSGIGLLGWGIGFGGWAWVQSARTGVVASTGTVMLGGVAVHPWISPGAAGDAARHSIGRRVS
jgi:hypothetical protein